MCKYEQSTKQTVIIQNSLIINKSFIQKSKKNNLHLKQQKEMNPFQKLKLTIDRIGLQYVPSNDNQRVTGQTVYKYTTNQQVEQNQQLPYFNTQGTNENAFKKHSAQFRAQEIEQLKTVFQNQHKNLVQEINSLNLKLQQQQLKLQSKSYENDRLISQLQSSRRQNQQLRAYIIDMQQKSARKMSQSGVLDRQRKFKEQIDRVNFTVAELAKELNAQKVSRKSIQRQLQQCKVDIRQKQQKMLNQNGNLHQQIDLLKQQLQKRAELLQHSIKSSRDDKITFKRQLTEMTQKYQFRIQSVKVQLQRSREQVYRLKNDLTEIKYEKENLRKEQQRLYQQQGQLQRDLLQQRLRLIQLKEKQQNLTQTIQQLRLKLAYLKQQLEEQRSNTRVKVVQVKDQSLQMELNMYRKQCKQLMKQKSIWESVRKDKSEYTIISENTILLNRSQNNSD